MTFENQSAYLPCAMQSVNTFQQPSLQPDQLTLILWYYDDALHRPTNCLKNCSLNTNEPPIYSIDFRAPDDARSSRTTATSQPNAVHFISNGEFKGRILFELNVCHLSGSLPLRASSPSSRSPGQRTAHQPSNLYQINYYHQTNSSFSLPFIRPICAFLKLNQVKKSDAGRFSCRLDFRRSRTLHTSLLLKVLGRWHLIGVLSNWIDFYLKWTKPFLFFRSTKTLRNSTQPKTLGQQQHSRRLKRRILVGYWLFYATDRWVIETSLVKKPLPSITLIAFQMVSTLSFWRIIAYDS